MMDFLKEIFSSVSHAVGGFFSALAALPGRVFGRRRKAADAPPAAGRPMFASSTGSAGVAETAEGDVDAKPRPAAVPEPAAVREPVGAAAGVAAAEAAGAAVDDLAARLADPGTSFYGQRVVSVAEAVKPAAPPPAPPVVEFRNVSKTYANGFTAIRDVNFCVEDLPGKGEFVCVLGPSGCGKSTILRLIAGLTPQHPATTGEVLVAGRPVEGPGADRGMVFQDYTSFDHRTVLDNIAFGLECRGVPRDEREERAREWIRKVGLSVERDQYKYPHQLSGGMRQRVAIARSLILSPRIILMDEPFGALDPATRLNMQDLLVNLWKEASATVFFITHSVEEAVYLGDRIYIMSPCPGTILEERKLPAEHVPAREAQRRPEFMQMVFDVRDTVEKLEESTRGGT
jgi:NitT/TauT family transport system ATP-binding protein